MCLCCSPLAFLFRTDSSLVMRLRTSRACLRCSASSARGRRGGGASGTGGSQAGALEGGAKLPGSSRSGLAQATLSASWAPSFSDMRLILIVAGTVLLGACKPPPENVPAPAKPPTPPPTPHPAQAARKRAIELYPDLAKEDSN